MNNLFSSVRMYFVLSSTFAKSYTVSDHLLGMGFQDEIRHNPCSLEAHNITDETKDVNK